MGIMAERTGEANDSFFKSKRIDQLLERLKKNPNVTGLKLLNIGGRYDRRRTSEKWSRGISEMDELSMEEKKIVCHQTAMQMVILWGTLEVIVIGFLVWAAFQYPEIIPSFNRITDLVNSNFEHSGTRAKRIGAIIVSLPALLPLIATVLIPLIGVLPDAESTWSEGQRRSCLINGAWKQI